MNTYLLITVKGQELKLLSSLANLPMNLAIFYHLIIYYICLSGMIKSNLTLIIMNKQGEKKHVYKQS